MPLPTAPPMIRPSPSVAIGVRDRAIQIASTITATALMTISAVWAIWLSFWNQPKLIPTFQASQRSKNGVTLTTPRCAMSNTNSSQSFEAWSSASTTIAAMMPGRKWELRKRSRPDTYLAFFFVFVALAAETFLAGFFAPFLAPFLAFFITFFAAFLFAGFFLAPLVAAVAFLAAFFLAGVFLLSVAPDFLASFFAAAFFAVLPIVFVPSLLAGLLFLGTATSTGVFSASCCLEISGSATTASTTRMGFWAGGAARAADASPNAFHSRSAWASRGETSGYSGSSPTVGRIFQERAHLVPTAFSTTTATPATSFSLNASDGASSLVTIAFEVMQTSARSMSNSVPKIFWSETYTSGDASSDEPMCLAARSTSSAPVTTRRTARIISHFAASLSSRKFSKLSGNSARCTDGSASGL